jgi:hypothetical protein
MYGAVPSLAQTQKGIARQPKSLGPWCIPSRGDIAIRADGILTSLAVIRLIGSYRSVLRIKSIPDFPTDATQGVQRWPTDSGWGK